MLVHLLKVWGFLGQSVWPIDQELAHLNISNSILIDWSINTIISLHSVYWGFPYTSDQLFFFIILKLSGPKCLPEGRCPVWRNFIKYGTGIYYIYKYRDFYQIWYMYICKVSIEDNTYGIKYRTLVYSFAFCFFYVSISKFY